MKKQIFIIDKLKDMSIKQLVYMEVEGYLYWISNSIPGCLGFLFRNLIAKFLFKKKSGFIWIQPRVTFVQTNRLSVGKNFGINTGSYINAKGGIYIGDNVVIGANVVISSGIHPIDGRDIPIFCRPTIPKKIIIEDDVWIGANAVILPGVVLKKGTVVGANAVVTKTTEEYSVVVGAPARHLRFRLG